MSKPIIKLYSFPTSYQIREKLSASGMSFKPFEAVKVSVVIKPKDSQKDDSFYWCGIQSCANNIRRNNTMSLKTYRRNL